jgi:large conductance mechanosensitive channel
MGFVQEFKEFALKGNVVDLAVGVIIGAAFGKIVNSMVQDIMMPIVSLVNPSVDLTNGKLVIREAKPEEKVVELTINYGNFISLVIEFIIVAFCLFIVIKGMNRLMNARGSLVPSIPGFGKKTE